MAVMIHMPKTIDNDLSGTERTLVFKVSNIATEVQITIQLLHHIDVCLLLK